MHIQTNFCFSLLLPFFCNYLALLELRCSSCRERFENCLQLLRNFAKRRKYTHGQNIAHT